jgi:hypothetical protein
MQSINQFHDLHHSDFVGMHLQPAQKWKFSANTVEAFLWAVLKTVTNSAGNPLIYDATSPLKLFRQTSDFPHIWDGNVFAICASLTFVLLHHYQLHCNF